MFSARVENVANFLPDDVAAEILRRLDAGQSTRVIADACGVARGTVQRYKHAVLIGHDTDGRAVYGPKPAPVTPTPMERSAIDAVNHAIRTAGITRSELARRMSVTPPFVSNILNGKSKNMTMRTCGFVGTIQARRRRR